MSKVTITRGGQVGVLTREADGRWGMAINGATSGSAYYTDEQVQSIVARAKADGVSKVDVE